ncbi:hypothetical protein CKO15_09895 [Halorhodospira abdelmalekii]|uniref:DUF2628 domain-containing protein n=1 Tax=Halorhodospira abdelmalekii TaxID=421629 RepID=UPI001903F786|nr:DUF2628 domain-containing protein [Halorhodospira abdelmalekii]MBK1735590.1 hypothetical protein [Halorhodospira abdelmalekii]
MKYFRIHEHPEHGLEAVKDGFSWPAFFFGIFWMLYKELWYPLLYLLAAGAGLLLLEGVLVATIVPFYYHDLVFMIFGAISLAIAIWVGTQANQWYAGRLRYIGYKEVSQQISGSPALAISQYQAAKS